MASYYLKQDKMEELKDGRTIVNMAKTLGITQRYLSLVLNGEKCKKMLAMSLINLKHKTPFYSIEMEEQLNYYFDKK